MNLNMIRERPNHRFKTLLQAQKHVRTEGYIIEFLVNEQGFYNPDNEFTYLPESISALEYIRFDAFMSDLNRACKLYLLQTIDNYKGWIHDANSQISNYWLSEHLARSKENFKHPN